MRKDGSVRAASADVLTLVFDGTFDAFAVERTRQALAQMSEQDHLVLDISKVHGVDWCALASLAADVVELAPGRASLTGYCEQHARLLSYLGLETLLESSTRPHASGTFHRMRLVR